MAILVTVALVLHQYRHILAGTATGTGYRFAGTPWYYRVFLARRGPVAWRTVYQPVGMVALVAATVIFTWQFYGEDSMNPQALVSSPLVSGLVVAPVIAASRSASLAVGLTRRAWVNHTLTATAVPTAVCGLAAAYRVAESQPPVDPAFLAVHAGLVVTSAAVAAGFGISVSYEDWGTAVIWVIGFGFVLGIIGGFGFNPAESLWQSLSALVMALLVAVFLVSYARGRALLGQPEWTMTSIIGGARRRYSRT